MPKCDYGCGQEVNYQFKNGKWCCSKNYNHCPEVKRKISVKMKKYIPWNKGKTNIYSEETLKKMKESHSGIKNYWHHQKLTEIHKQKISDSHKGKIINKETKEKLQKALKGNVNAKGKKYKQSVYENRRMTIKVINKRYPFFSKIEEMRYNPINIDVKEIQVRCKNHNCSNSKEQGGWFTPTYIQLYERIRQLEKGNGGSYFYCCEECKNECPLYRLRNDPYKTEEDDKFTYSSSELHTLNQFVMTRYNYTCQYCGKKATEVHHIKPKKLEPFFALDPDYTIAVCKKCHYKYGHKKETECNTQKLSIIKCKKE